MQRRSCQVVMGSIKLCDAARWVRQHFDKHGKVAVIDAVVAQAERLQLWAAAQKLLHSKGRQMSHHHALQRERATQTGVHTLHSCLLLVSLTAIGAEVL